MSDQISYREFVSKNMKSGVSMTDVSKKWREYKGLPPKSEEPKPKKTPKIVPEIEVKKTRKTKKQSEPVEEPVEKCKSCGK